MLDVHIVLTARPGRPCNPLCPFKPGRPLGPLSPGSPLSPRIPCGPYKEKGQIGHLPLKDDTQFSTNIVQSVYKDNSRHAKV